MTDAEYAETMFQLRALAPKDLLYRLLFGEARGECLEAQVGVGCVVRNRVFLHDPAPMPRTWSDIMLARAQFSCFLQVDPNLPKLLDPEGHEEFVVLQQLKWVAQGVTDAALRDNVGGANHYYDFSLIVGQGQERDPSRLSRYLQAVDVILHPMPTATWDDIKGARDLIHTLVKDLPPKWAQEVLPVARKGRLVFFQVP